MRSPGLEGYEVQVVMEAHPRHFFSTATVEPQGWIQATHGCLRKRSD